MPSSVKQRICLNHFAWASDKRTVSGAANSRDATAIYDVCCGNIADKSDYSIIRMISELNLMNVNTNVDKIYIYRYIYSGM